MKKKIEKMKARKMARGLAVKAFFGGTVISVVSFGIVGGLCCWIFDVWSFKDFVLKMKTYFRRSATIFNPLGDFVAKTSELVRVLDIFYFYYLYLMPSFELYTNSKLLLSRRFPSRFQTLLCQNGSDHLKRNLKSKKMKRLSH